MWFGGYYGLELTQSTITGNTAIDDRRHRALRHGSGRGGARRPPRKGAGRQGREGQERQGRRLVEGPGQVAGAQGEWWWRARAGRSVRSRRPAPSSGATSVRTSAPTATRARCSRPTTRCSAWSATASPSPTPGARSPASTRSLGPLQNNGGPTETHELLAGSPAINTGSQPGAELPDQRVRPARSRVRPGRRRCGRHRCVRGAAAADARADRHHAQVHRLSRRSGPASGPER